MPTSQSYVELEEKDLTMVKVDVGVLHEKDELSPWMSQLFEKLDLEAVDEDICSIEKTVEKNSSPLKKDKNPIQKDENLLQKWGIGPFDKETSEHMHPVIRADLAKKYYLCSSCEARGDYYVPYKRQVGEVKYPSKSDYKREDAAGTICWQSMNFEQSDSEDEEDDESNPYDPLCFLEWID